ncbi:MAG: hypothetical protein KO318_04960 [Methanobacterium sp.]|uniref:hypothetical protein n=1 Tax=Methanobacterium sp. TaxID=2164 RepID=UPI00258499AD|nr:hypothetical protein [Methanobacterium sp.]MCC7559764.1 hypothetical protein [Methanobacterium sp.]
MKEYISVDGIGLDTFLKNLSKMSEEGWEPVWSTFKEDDSNEKNPVFVVILERVKKRDLVLGLG